MQIDVAVREAPRCRNRSPSSRCANCRRPLETRATRRLGDVVQRVIGRFMQERQPRGGANALSMKFMYVPGLQPIDLESHAFAIVSDDGLFDRRRGAIDLRTAVR